MVIIYDFPNCRNVYYMLLEALVDLIGKMTIPNSIELVMTIN
jgi:hypothetical protein